jgi:hypothetical protein
MVVPDAPLRVFDAGNIHSRGTRQRIDNPRAAQIFLYLRTDVHVLLPDAWSPEDIGPFVQITRK